MRSLSKSCSHALPVYHDALVHRLPKQSLQTLDQRDESIHHMPVSSTGLDEQWMSKAIVEEHEPTATQHLVRSADEPSRNQVLAIDGLVVPIDIILLALIQI